MVLEMRCLDSVRIDFYSNETPWSAFWAFLLSSHLSFRLCIRRSRHSLQRSSAKSVTPSKWMPSPLRTYHALERVAGPETLAAGGLKCFFFTFLCVYVNHSPFTLLLSCVGRVRIQQGLRVHPVRWRTGAADGTHINDGHLRPWIQASQGKCVQAVVHAALRLYEGWVGHLARASLTQATTDFRSALPFPSPRETVLGSRAGTITISTLPPVVERLALVAEVAPLRTASRPLLWPWWSQTPVATPRLARPLWPRHNRQNTRSTGNSTNSNSSSSTGLITPLGPSITSSTTSLLQVAGIRHRVIRSQGK